MYTQATKIGFTCPKTVVFLKNKPGNDHTILSYICHVNNPSMFFDIMVLFLKFKFEFDKITKFSGFEFAALLDTQIYMYIGIPVLYYWYF